MNEKEVKKFFKETSVERLELAAASIELGVKRMVDEGKIEEVIKDLNELTHACMVSLRNYETMHSKGLLRADKNDPKEKWIPTIEDAMNRMNFLKTRTIPMVLALMEITHQV